MTIVQQTVIPTMSSNPNALPNLLVFPNDRQLTGISNWASFRDHLKSVARSTGLLGYLDGSTAQPTPLAGTAGVPPPATPTATPINSRTPSVEEWELRDGRLAGIIYQNIQDPRSIGVTEDMASNIMWRKLTGEFDTNSAAAQALAKERIQQFKYTPGTRFEEYFKNLEALRKAANDVGCSIQDEDLRTRFLTSLSKEYLWILQTHGARPLPDLKRVLLEYDMMYLPHFPCPAESFAKTATEMVTLRRGAGLEMGDGMEPVKTSASSSAATTIVTESSAPSIAAATIYHFDDQDFNGTAALPPRINPLDHLVSRLGGETDPVLNIRGCDGGSVEIFAVPSRNENNFRDVPTYLDSAATHWCIRDRRRFITYTSENSVGRMAEEGSRGSFNIEGYGIAEISIRTNEGSINCLRFPAKHTPSFGMNLISIPALDRKGLRGEWGDGRIMVKDPASGRCIIDGHLAAKRSGNSLYRVNVIDNLDSLPALVTSPDSTFVLASSGKSRSNPCSLAMWHARFGHADVNMIRIMAKRGLVDGLEVTDYELCGKCEPCLFAKAKRLPFDDIVIPASEPLDRVSLDLWGPSRTRSLGGANYMLLACNDGTGIPFPYFSPNKESQSILKYVQDFVKMAERQTGRKVKVFRVDMGREFDNKLMDAWCAERGIIVEKVPKASSAANGQVERANGTIISGVRAMIEDSDLDTRFWAEGSSAYCYVRGMIPTNRHPGRIPWEKWYELDGRKVNVSHLRRWGCKVWVTDLDRVNGKLGRQAWEGRFVGYLGRRGYRVWDPARRAVYPVRDVVFEEGFPRRTTGVTPQSDGPIFDTDLEPDITARPKTGDSTPSVSTSPPNLSLPTPQAAPDIPPASTCRFFDGPLGSARPRRNNYFTSNPWKKKTGRETTLKNNTVNGFTGWDLTDVRDKNFLVGLTIEHHNDGSITISQAPFFHNAFKYFGIIDDLRPIFTPLPPNFSFERNEVQTEEDRLFMKGKPYRGILGCCWWGASSTRPDIVYACAVLSTVQNAPKQVHWDLLIKLCRYIFFTVRYGIIYRPGTISRIKLIGYVDADWAGDKSTRKSMSGYIFLVNGSPVAWSSKRQDSIALSSTEAEFISMSRGVQQALWMRSWLDEVELGLGDDALDIFYINFDTSRHPSVLLLRSEVATLITHEAHMAFGLRNKGYSQAPVLVLFTASVRLFCGIYQGWEIAPRILADNVLQDDKG
ncbi:hypothetical protein D9757_001100 [Collybiopsis confluens]|uniref:Integrase catalytic domain-containing protein n=1 Tax=Collybiopsis confluens TaxID=2823264 RepID=A0A8H5I0Y3_9AGAR|nr:hypothetical protein D9757_001100 [Collybiopsis confluens]